jgi:hypothetical protein
MYGLWMACHSIIFQDKDIPSAITTCLAKKLSKEYKLEPKQKKPRVLVMPQFDLEVP